MSGSQDQFVGLRDLHGRQMNSLNRDYMLPADSPEMQRLNIQHRMMRMAMGGLYPDNYAEAIRRRLEYEEGKTIEIADLGSGSGDWISDMAREFPHTYAVGVDLAPSAPTEVPSNVKFETRDVTKGLDGYNGKFDMVQARSIANGIDDYQVFVRSIADSLKPGGIVMLMEGYLELYDQDLKRRDSASGVSKLLSEVVARQPSPNKLGLNRAGDLLEERLREHGAFENIKVEYLYVPIGWNGSPEHCKEPTAASRLMMDNMTTFVGAWKPMLLSMEVPEADIDLWVFGAREELKTPEIMKAYTKWIVVCGTKSE